MVDWTDRGATISADGLYRYLLWRQWDNRRRFGLFIMLNPSTADADIDDPTIRRCIGFARAWDLGGIRVVNLYPFRATKPADLWRADCPEGNGNLGYIRLGAVAAAVCIAAWGAHAREPAVAGVRSLFAELCRPLHCLGTTKSGQPTHPLYLASTTQPEVWFNG